MSASGIVAVDAAGRSLPLSREGRPVGLDPAEATLFLDGHDAGGRFFPRRGTSGNEREVAGLGTWIASTAKAGLVLRSKGPVPSCLEALLAMPDEGTARLRSLYARPGIAVVVTCASASRAREAALALCAERRALGLPTSLALSPSEEERPRRDGPRAHPPAHAESGPFDEPSRPGAAPWSIAEVDEKGLAAAFGPPPDASSRIAIFPEPRHARHRIDRLDAYVSGLAHPCVLVRVGIVDSTPTAGIVLSPAAMALSSPDAVFEDAPWTLHGARRAARAASRPPKPRTWHRTTAGVAEAFLAREAPRGHVSGRPIYFHGPVAYSLFDTNPIAAIVDAPDGRPVLLTGRDERWGGTTGQTITSATNDIVSAARGSFRVLHLQDLRPLVTLGDMRLADVPGRIGASKSEADHPPGATLHLPALRAWISAERERREAGVEAAFRTRFHTHNQANALRALHGLAVLRDALAEAFRARLPEVGDPEALKARTRASEAGAQARQDELAARSRLQKEFDRLHPPAPPADDLDPDDDEDVDEEDGPQGP